MSAGQGSSTDPFNIDNLNDDDESGDEFDKNLTPDMVKYIKSQLSKEKFIQLNRENFILSKMDKLPEELRDLVIEHHALRAETVDRLGRLENLNRITLNQKEIENDIRLQIQRQYVMGIIDDDTAIRRLDGVIQRTEDLATTNTDIIQQYERELEDYFKNYG